VSAAALRLKMLLGPGRRAEAASLSSSQLRVVASAVKWAINACPLPVCEMLLKSGFEQLRIPSVAGWRDLGETGGGIIVSASSPVAA
jgi:hypothetical protein